MKKALYLFAAAALLLQACSTNKSFTKKRYGHLKWIDHNTEVEVPGKDPKAGETADKTKPEKADAATFVTEKKQEAFVQQEPVTPVTEPATPVLPVSKPVQKAEKQADEDSDSEIKDVAETPETIIGQEQGPSIGQAGAKPMMDETAKLIICVILAIFISPLGMYLWDQQTDVWFVVDLIFWLLWAFFIFGYGFGLLGLLAIVIALLRVFSLL